MQEHAEAYFDTDLRVGYVYVVDKPVERTLEFNDQLLIDVASNGDVVGVEVLDRLHSVPVREMAEHYRWDAKTWAAVDRAARSLETVMNTSVSSGGDRTYRPSRGWANRSLTPA